MAGTAAAAGSAALLVSLLFVGTDDGVSLAVYLAVVGAVLVVQILRWPGRRWQIDRRAVPSLVRLPEAAPEPPVPGPVTELEGLMSEGAHSPRAATRRLRPRLIEVTRARLLDRRGIRLDEQPRAARHALGDDAWAVVAPDRPADRAVHPSEVERLVHRLERL